MSAGIRRMPAKRPTVRAIRALAKLAREIEAEYASQLRYHDARGQIYAPEDSLVSDLGERVGYGALMTAAAKEWRASLTRRGHVAGSEFVPGPCAAVMRVRLRELRRALRAVEGK